MRQSISKGDRRRNFGTWHRTIRRSGAGELRSKLTDFTALAVVATALAIMFFGATLPTPLYPFYRVAFGFSHITLTLIYAIYVLGNLVALLFFGRLSDQIGRRPATVPAIGFGLVSTLVFLFANGTIWLFVARVLSGFATGLAAGAATAWLAELQPQGDRAAAASLASAANFAGLALAPLLAGTLAQFAPSPLRIPYVIYLMMLIGIGLAILEPRETVKHRDVVPWTYLCSPDLASQRRSAWRWRFARGDRLRHLCPDWLLRCSSQLVEREPATEVTACGRRRGFRALRGSHGRCCGDRQITRPPRDAERARAIAPQPDASGHSPAVALDAAIIAGNDARWNLRQLLDTAEVWKW